MTLRECLSDRLGRICLQLACAGLAALFLAATGTQTGVLVLLFLALLLMFAVVQVSDFLRQRARLRELETILDGLDRKYLFAECAPPPKGLYERRLFDLMRRAGRDMVGAVSDAQATQREYREYVERWVHEVKTPITAARLICRELDGEKRRKLTAELARIEAHVERALFYARAENPEQDCLFRQVNLGEIAAQAIENHRSLMIQSGVRVETEHLDCRVYTDEKWAVFILGSFSKTPRGTGGKTRLSPFPRSRWESRQSSPSGTTAWASRPTNCPASLTGASPAATGGARAAGARLPDLPAWVCICAKSWRLFWIWGCTLLRRREKEQR